MNTEQPGDGKKTTADAGPWLTRASTIRGLWWGGGIILALVTLADLIIVRDHAVVPIAGSFGFYSWYGFATCAVMVIVAKGLGIVLKRDDGYYEP